ncbi:MAG: hypothetical protein CVU65_04350 [Deltaproteobacteria bacterium HGW-Deltaproteobacteria-22]|nr:MAG: hypothetical protein CVU65_04350 [Deltaproteobacteria bacterium HGW-Deltaproteobacteria-22]
MKKCILLTLGAIAILGFGCAKAPRKEPTKKDSSGVKPVVAKPETKDAPGVTRGLLFTLEKGPGSSGAGATVQYTPGTPLTEAESQALLARLQPWKDLPDLKKNFAFRDRSLPPPRTGAVVQTAWPPPPKPVPTVEPAGALEVVRTSPTTDVYIAPNISVTFSQPMVAITSHADTIAKGVPVKISPEVKGKWRWLGTKTLIFESELERLPKSTRYTVTVPAGIASAKGEKLAKEVSWEFSTPTIQVETFHPQHGPQILRPVFFIRFDQRIDPAAVLASMVMQSNASVNVPLRMATEDEIKKDTAVQGMVEYARKEFEGRHFAFVPVQELVPATSYTIRIGPGTGSLEGPEKTREPIIHSLRTYDPLTIEDQNCKPQYKCRPPYAMFLRFNNPLDEEKFTPDLVKVSPAIDDMEVTARGNSIVITGRIKGRRDYKVTIGADLKDTFGQTLGSTQERTFQYREAEPDLLHSYRNLTVADPSAKPEVRFSSINIPKIDVQVYRVKPEHYYKYLEYARVYRYDPKPPAIPGTLVLEKSFKLDGSSDELVESVVDLKKVVNQDGNGQFMVIVSQSPRPEEKYRWQTFITWIQFTKIGVDAHMDARQLLALVTKLSDGKPVSGAEVSILTGPSGKTDASGLSTIALPDKLDSDLGGLLVARTGSDLVFLPRESYSYYGGSGKYLAHTPSERDYRFFTFDDRKLYKPKESVNIKGWMRVVGLGRDATLSLPGEIFKEVSWTVYDPRNNKIGEGKTPMNILGGFHFAFTLPDNTNLGSGRVEITTNLGFSTTHYFTIQEFRKPEFEVGIASSEGPFILGDRADLTLSASYFSGGGLPGAEVNWNVSASPGHFSPPGLWEWSFGDSSMRWWFFEDDDNPSVGVNTSQHLAGATDSRGQHSVRLTFKDARPAIPYSVTAFASVVDVNRQSWTSNKSLLVHPADRYVGLRTKKYFVPENTPMIVEAIATDLEGKKLADATITVTAELDEWKYHRGKYRRIHSEKQTCTVTTSATAESTCTFKTPKGGSYLISATITDAKGRTNASKITRWVEGGGLPPVRVVERERVNMILDKKEYKPGDTAEIFIQAPFYPAEGLWFVRHVGIDKPVRFTMTGPTHVLKVPLTEAHMPSTEVWVELVGSAARVDDAGKPVAGAPNRPAYAGNTITVPVSLESRKLDLKITPESAQLMPGGKTRVTLEVLDHQKKPVADAEIALVAVDEAVLALTGYRVPDPIYSFYPSRAGGSYHRWLREHVLLSDPLKLKQEADMVAAQSEMKMAEASPSADRGGMPPPAPGAKRGLRKERAKDKMDSAADMPAEEDESGKTGDDGQPVKVRSNFNSLALFAPELRTGPDGKATVELALPDNLTRYRLMAVVVSGATHYGLGESQVTARLPVQVRPSPPRFLNFGDQFELPIVVQNQTNVPQEIKVAVRGWNVKWKGPIGQKVTVPALDRRELRFSVGTDMAGTAKFEAVAVGAGGSDAAGFELPVWTPATTEGFATYGTIDAGSVVQPVQVPSNVVMEFGGLNVQTSSTQLQALTDAVLYLYAYPYECAEQLSSRILSIAALRDVLTAFQAAGLPSSDKIAAAMARDLQKLAGMQNYDGGFGFWIRGQESWPFLTIHVAHALLRAKEKGYGVSEQTLSRAMQYLKHIERHIPPDYPEWVKRSIIAYSLFVRNLNKDPDPAKAIELYPHFADGKQPDLEGVGWLYPVFISAKKEDHLVKIRKLLLNRVSETAGNAHFITYASDGAHLILHSDRRVDALLLSGVMLDQPKSDLIAKIVAGLLAHRKQGRWTNTQESVWVLLAMDQYFNTFEKVTPNFVSRMWLGDKFAGEHKFVGRTTERHVVSIPMLQLGKPGDVKDLLLAKEGAGRLYYRIGMDYALSDLRPPAADHGFTLSRSYAAVDDPKSVERLADGTWRIKAGSRVKVTLTMLAPSRRYHVALVDPLPAGLEAENAALLGAPPASSASSNTSYGPGGGRHGGRNSGRSYMLRWWRMWGHWYEHHNIRDERVEAFTSLLDAGVHTFVYTARATTPGNFVVPPLKAEEMYAPETFGRSAGDRVIVVP